MVYLPYWRFKGIQYSVTPAGVTHRFTDISWLALDRAPDIIPFSLGFRSQALTLTRVSARTPGTFIRPTGFRQSFPRDRKKDSGPASFAEDIGETSSLIFAPYYEEDGTISDGILDRELGRGNSGLSDIGDACRPEKETRILPGLCPDCGWDLEGQSDSLVLVCRNCHTLWQPRDEALGRIRFGSAPPRNKTQVLLPFWRISAEFSGLALDTVQDLRHFANLPGGPADTPENHRLSFWAPAFKIRPKIFLRISRQLTLAQPHPALEKVIRPHTHLPITLPAGEAVQSIRITLASLARPLREHFTGLSGAGVRAESATLVYLPFDAGPHEFTQKDLGLSINKTVLRLSDNL